MEVIIRVILMFFFIQFLVVITVMAVALLLARHEVPVWGRESWRGARGPCSALVSHLPTRVRRSVIRLLQSIHLRSVG
ncbi:MAG TPA: hypothetical protein VEN79_10525 [Terriglobia bacterium]|nr:hypothetical protein [Terriglobia bacterium]